MTLEHPLVEQNAAGTWISPASGVWAASKHGNHLGFIERIDGRYAATNHRGQALGVFDDLAAAQAAVDGLGDATLPSRTATLMTKATVAISALVATLAAMGIFALTR
jgi:hypothetical protein